MYFEDEFALPPWSPVSSPSPPPPPSANIASTSSNLPDVRDMLKRYSLKVISDGRLIAGTKYDLNMKTCICNHSRYVEVGYSSALDTVQPLVEIACHCCDLYGGLIYLTKNDWFQFVTLESSIRDFFNDNRENADNKTVMTEVHDIDLLFTTRDDEKRIGLASRAEEISLNKAECLRLFEFVNLISYKLQLLIAQDFCNYYNSIIEISTSHALCIDECTDDELLSKIKNILRCWETVNSSNYFCLIEMLQFYPQKVANDFRDTFERARQ